jgi:hypothetical protein
MEALAGSRLRDSVEFIDEKWWLASQIIASGLQLLR